MSNGTEAAKVKEAIRAIVKDLITESGISCKVLEVDKEGFTIDVESLDTGVKYFDVRLLASSGDEVTGGITAFPKVGSSVVIVTLDGMDEVAFVSKMSEIESYEIKIGPMTFYMDKDVIKLNGEAYNLVKSDEVAARIAAIETKMNALTLPVSGATAGPPTPPPFTTITTESDISNAKVKHG